MKKIIIFMLAILAASSLLLASCERGNNGTDNGGEYEGKFEYNVFSGVVVSAGESGVERNGNFEISEIKVAVGDVVKEGDVLFTYDTQKAKLDLEKAKLELEQYGLSLSNYTETKKNLEAEKAAAPADQQLRYSLEIQQIETDILETEYNIKLKEKEIENFEANLENTEVTSPVSGTVKSINRDSYDGSFIVITESGNMRVQGYVNEANMSDINIGDPVTVKSRVDGTEYTGFVTEIDLEKPEQSQQGGNYYYFDDASYGADVDSSSKYPFYVQLTDTEGLFLGQHVYILTEQSGDAFLY